MAWEDLEQVGKPSEVVGPAGKVEKLLTLSEIPFKPSGIKMLDDFRQAALDNPGVKFLGELGGDVASWGYGASRGKALGSALGMAGGDWRVRALQAAGAGLSYALQKGLRQSLLGETPSNPVKEAVEGAALEVGFQALGPAFKLGKEKVYQPVNRWIDRNVSEPLQDVTSAIFKDWKPFSSKEMVWQHNKQVPVQVKKSIADIFQPAVDRLPWTQKEVFRDSQALKANLSRIGSELGQKVAPLNAVEKFEVMKGLRGTSVKGMSLPARRVLEDFDLQVKDLTLPGKYENAFREDVAKALNVSFNAPQKVFSGNRAIGRLQQVMATKAPFQVKVPSLQKSLRGIIEDTMQPDEIRALARDLHDLHAVLPSQVADSAKKVTQSMLFQHLNKMPGVVLDKKPLVGANEYMPSLFYKDKSGSSKWVRRDVELELRAMDEVPKISHSWMNKWFITPWKTWKVIDRPAAWVRNGLTNLMLNHMSGMPFWRQDLYKASLKGMASGSAEWKEFKKITGTGGNFSVEDVFKMNEGMKYGSNMMDKILTYHDKVQKPFRSLYSAEESMFKFAKYLHNLEKGMPKKQAAWDAVEATFNYGEVTRATAFTRSNIAPFFTWTSKAIPKVWGWMTEHPVQAASMLTLYQGMQSEAIRRVGMDDEEWKQFNKMLPEYIQQGMFFVLPWRDQDQRLQMLNLTYIIPGFGDLNELMAHPAAAIIGNPLVSIASALTTNRKFSGVPIYYEWEPVATRTQKMLAHLWETLVPAPFIGGTDYKMLKNAYEANFGNEFQRTPQDLTPGQAVSSFVSGKITPVDIPETERKWGAKVKMQKSEARQDFLREARKVRSQEQMDSLIKKYEEVLPSIVGQE